MYAAVIEVPAGVIQRWRHRERSRGERHEPSACLPLFPGNVYNLRLRTNFCPDRHCSSQFRSGGNALTWSGYDEASRAPVLALLSHR